MRQLSVDYNLALAHQFNASLVDTAYDQVNQRWLESQSELSTGMDNIANILQAIRQAFEQAEVQLTSALVGGSPSGAGATA